MLRQFRATIIVALTFLLSACPAPRRPAPEPERPPPPVFRPVPGAQLLQIVPAESLLKILVYRGGTLASAGHNHVIASHQLSGRIDLHQKVNQSAFELKIPVQSLSVDEAPLRAAEGAAFAAAVPDSARQATRKNLLSEALLDAERYPFIRVISSAISADDTGAAVAVSIGIKDQWRTLITPLKLQISGGRVTADGEFELRQSDLGLKPFSVLMGALQVQDVMRIKFHVVATSAADTGL